MTHEERDINEKRSILECPHPPNKDGFCTIPEECIAKRMFDQEDCDLVCKAMQELRASNADTREKVLIKLDDRLKELISKETGISFIPEIKKGRIIGLLNARSEIKELRHGEQG